MNRKELSQVRRHLGRTQMEMAQLLGVSVKGIQSFEQGWRGIPAATERELLMLLGLKKALVSRKRPCWSIKGCSEENRRMCPVWEFGAGNICWLFNGTRCRGKADSWAQKTKRCRKCEVFQSTFDLDDRGGFVLRSNAKTVCSSGERQ
jgi:DNA-binding XRE family transcriptional regulator